MSVTLKEEDKKFYANMNENDCSFIKKLGQHNPNIFYKHKTSKSFLMEQLLTPEVISFSEKRSWILTYITFSDVQSHVKAENICFET